MPGKGICVVLKRFLLALAIFVGVIIPGAFIMALFAASAYPKAVAVTDGYAATRLAEPDGH